MTFDFDDSIKVSDTVQYNTLHLTLYLNVFLFTYTKSIPALYQQGYTSFHWRAAT